MSREEAVTSRRTLLAGVGAVGAVSVLAACGSDDDPAGSGSGTGQNPEPTDQAEEPGEQTGGGGEVVGKVSGRAGRRRRVVPSVRDGGDAADRGTVPRVPGGVHPPGLPDRQRREWHDQLCSCHGSKFALDSGEPRNGPATRPLTPREVTVKGDDIVLA